MLVYLFLNYVFLNIWGKFQSYVVCEFFEKISEFFFSYCMIFEIVSEYKYL